MGVKGERVSWQAMIGPKTYGTNRSVGHMVVVSLPEPQKKSMACRRGRGGVGGGRHSEGTSIRLPAIFAAEKPELCAAAKCLKWRGGKESWAGGRGGGELLFFPVVFNSAGLASDGSVNFFDELLVLFRRIV